jgi:hypothetical protein
MSATAFAGCYGTGCYNTYSEMMDSGQAEVDQLNMETRMRDLESQMHYEQQRQTYDPVENYSQPLYGAPAGGYISDTLR